MTGYTRKFYFIHVIMYTDAPLEIKSLRSKICTFYNKKILGSIDIHNHDNSHNTYLDID